MNGREASRSLWKRGECISIWHNSGASWRTKWSSLNERLVERPQPSDNTNARAGRCFSLSSAGPPSGCLGANKGTSCFRRGSTRNYWQIPARSGRLPLRHRILPQPLCVQSCHGRYGLSWRYLKDICGSLSIIWVMMGLRFMGASPSQEGKWLPYWLPYQFALGHCGPYLRLIAVSFISALRAAIGSAEQWQLVAIPGSPRHRRTFESCS